jgi:LPXTG-motif cell wall-anchored protein
VGVLGGCLHTEESGQAMVNFGKNINGERLMYGAGEVLAAATPPVAAAAVLPNTGASSSVVVLAVAVIAGLSIWAVLYHRANR